MLSLPYINYSAMLAILVTLNCRGLAVVFSSSLVGGRVKEWGPPTRGEHHLWSSMANYQLSRKALGKGCTLYLAIILVNCFIFFFFSYRGEKLDRVQRKRPLTRDVLISTVYDKPCEKEATVLRSAPVGTLKYRDFRTGGILNHPPNKLP